MSRVSKKSNKKFRKIWTRVLAGNSKFLTSDATLRLPSKRVVEPIELWFSFQFKFSSLLSVGKIWLKSVKEKMTYAALKFSHFAAFSHFLSLMQGFVIKSAANRPEPFRNEFYAFGLPSLLEITGLCGRLVLKGFFKISFPDPKQPILYLGGSSA